MNPQNQICLTKTYPCQSVRRILADGPLEASKSISERSVLTIFQTLHPRTVFLFRLDLTIRSCGALNPFDRMYEAVAIFAQRRDKFSGLFVCISKRGAGFAYDNVQPVLWWLRGGPQ